MNNDFFVNTAKHPKSSFTNNNHHHHHDTSQRSLHKKIDMSEDQALDFLRNRKNDSKPHRDHPKSNTDFFSSVKACPDDILAHHTNNSNNPSVISNLTLTNSNQYLLQPVSLSNNQAEEKHKQLIDNNGVPSVSIDDNFLKHFSLDLQTVFAKIDFGIYLISI